MKEASQQQQSRSQLVMPKRSPTMDAIASSIAMSHVPSTIEISSTLPGIGSSLKNEYQLAGGGLTGGGVNKLLYRYLSFTVNVLIYVLWESLFYNN